MAEKPDIFMPLYIGDYLAGTSRLTTELHGAYLLLIMDYWMNGPPPDNDAELASITKMSPDAWSNAKAVLRKYFNVKCGVWIHGRIDEELEAAYEKKRKAKSRAKRAAAVRWGKNNDATSNATSNAYENLEECPSPSPIYKPPTCPEEDISTNLSTEYLGVDSETGEIRELHGGGGK